MPSAIAFFATASAPPTTASLPQPIDDYTTSLVLTMDLVDGRVVGLLGG